MTKPTADDLETALRQMLRASQAYGRQSTDAEQHAFHQARDAAQTLLRRTPTGQQSAI